MLFECGHTNHPSLSSFQVPCSQPSSTGCLRYCKWNTMFSGCAIDDNTRTATEVISDSKLNPRPISPNSIQFIQFHPILFDPIPTERGSFPYIPILSESFRREGHASLFFHPRIRVVTAQRRSWRTVLSTWRPELRRPGDSSTLSALGCHSGVALAGTTNWETDWEKLSKKNE